MKFNEENMPKHIAIIMDEIEDGQERKESLQVLGIKREPKHLKT